MFTHIKNYIRHPQVFKLVLLERISPLLSTETYLRWRWMVKMGYPLPLDNPQTFNEKLQWLKVHDHNPLYSTMVDKYRVKEYVAQKLGAEYVVPLLGVWDRAEDIDWDCLPQRFVLKCTHDSSGLVICKDKSKLDRRKTVKKLGKALKVNYFNKSREWPYKNVQRKIIAEQFLEDTHGGDLADYKIHCFNGVPKVILVCKDRFTEHGLTEDFFSDKWEHLDVKRPHHPQAGHDIDTPAELQEMLRCASELAKDIPFVRVDFYTANNKVYFGELTFFPAGGMVKFEPEEWDYKLGSWTKLPLQ